METKRCGDVIQGRKESQVLQRGGSLHIGGGGGVERKRKNRITPEKSSKSLTGKTIATDNGEFLQAMKLKV